MNSDVNNSSLANSLITHENETFDDDFDIKEYETKLKDKSDLVLPLEKELDILKQLAEFELGKFLLRNKGLNGYWTSYLISNDVKEEITNLEHWILNKAPATKATRERYYIFKDFLQRALKDNIKVASIPCGIMNDLLELKIEEYKGLTFVGVDYDSESIEHIKSKSQSANNVRIVAIKRDAWNLGFANEFNILTSNGLNIYEHDEEKLVALYKNFYDALKSNGTLITSFLTPPPIMSKDSTWQNFNMEDVITQKAIFFDIIGVKWQSFRTEEQVKQELSQVGFRDIQFVYDSQGMFPTVIAKKL